MGGAILAFPYAFKEAGLVMAVLACIALASIMGFCLHVIVYSTSEAQKADPGVRSYEDLVLAAAGPKSAIAMEVIIVFYQYGAVLGFLIIIGDMLTPVFEELMWANHFLSNRQVIIGANEAL